MYVQKSMVESYGLQCGFCTPGMIMTMYCLLRNNPKPTQEDMERALEGTFISIWRFDSNMTILRHIKIFL